MIIGDNVVRDGAVTDAASTDARVQGVREFFTMMAQEPPFDRHRLANRGQQGLGRIFSGYRQFLSDNVTKEAYD